MLYRGSMPRLTAAKLRIPSATISPPRIMIQGHSVVVGQGSGTGTYFTTGGRETSWPVKLAKSLGWQTGSFFGTGSVNAVGGGLQTVPDYDPRLGQGSWVVDSNAALGGSAATVGGALWSVTGASTTDFTFTPETAFDVYTVYTLTLPGAASSVSIKLDGNVVQTLNQNASNNVVKSTFTCTLGTHTISIQNNGTGTAYLIGMETRVSTSTAPMLLHCAKCGGTLDQLNTVTNPWSWSNVVNILAPDVVMTQCLINDIAGQAATPNTLVPKINTLTLACVARSADPIWMVDQPFGSGGNAGNVCFTDGSINIISSQMKSNCLTYDGSFGDFRGTFGSSVAMAQTRGFYSGGDTAHPRAPGTTAMAEFAAKVFQ